MIGLGQEGSGWLHIRDGANAGYTHLAWVRVPWGDDNLDDANADYEVKRWLQVLTVMDKIFTLSLRRRPYYECS